MTKQAGRRTKGRAGMKFGRLTLLEFIRANQYGKAIWRCQCDCGRVCEAQFPLMKRGATKSCGCYRNEVVKLVNTRHGHSHSPTWKSWAAMIQRCLNPKAHNFPNYGGRGIGVCQRWELFDNFLADMGERPLGTTLGRIDNTESYTPANCRWEDAKTQQRNKRDNRRVGQYASIAEAADSVGLKRKTLTQRLRMGWSDEKALTSPMRKGQANEQV